MPRLQPAPPASWLRTNLKIHKLRHKHGLHIPVRELMVIYFPKMKMDTIRKYEKYHLGKI